MTKTVQYTLRAIAIAAGLLGGALLAYSTAKAATVIPYVHAFCVEEEAAVDLFEAMVTAAAGDGEFVTPPSVIESCRKIGKPITLEIARRMNLERYNTPYVDPEDDELSIMTRTLENGRVAYFIIWNYRDLFKPEGSSL